ALLKWAGVGVIASVATAGTVTYVASTSFKETTYEVASTSSASMRGTQRRSPTLGSKADPDPGAGPSLAVPTAEPFGVILSGPKGREELPSTPTLDAPG